MRTSFSLLSLLAIAACSSSGGTQTATGVAGEAGLAFSSAVTDFDAEATNVGLATASNTRFDAIPTTGTANFAGFLNVNAGPEADLTAQLELVADFATTEISGNQVGSFFAVTDDGLEEYTGVVDVTFGRTGARGIANNARIDIAGTITNDVNTVAVDGEILGKFIGTPIIGAEGIVNTGDQVANPAFVSGDVSADAAPETIDALNLTLNGEAVTDGSAGFSVLAVPTAE